MKNAVEEKIDSIVTDAPSFEEVWNKVDTTKLVTKKSKKPWIIGFVSGAVALSATIAIVTPIALINRAPESYTGVRLLKEPAKAQYNHQTSVISNVFKAKLNNFSAKFADLAFKEMEDKDDNLCVSPLSLYMALALVEQCAGGNAREEILSALGMTHSDVETMTRPLFERSTREYYSDSNEPTLLGKESLTNSIWMDPTFNKKQACLDELADNMYCYPYEADWQRHNMEANRALRRFIADETNGLIDHDWNIGSDTAFLLMNTLYWKDSWLNDGEAIDKWLSTYSFTNSKNEKKDLDAYCGTYLQGRAYQNEKYITFPARTNHGYYLKFVMPKDGVSLDEIWNENTIKEVNVLNYFSNFRDEEERKQYFTRCIFPEFEVGGKLDLENIFRSGFGIEEIYTNPYSMGTLTDDLVVCSGAIQETKLNINKKGGEGAAVTMVWDKVTSTGPDEYTTVYENFIVDRAFGYILSDCDNTPLFAGVMNNI